MLPPSLYAHTMNGLLVFAAVVVAYINFSVLRRLDPYKLVMIFLIFSIAIGVHGLSHMGLVAVYGFNPLK
jgi:tetrahydromethanopterin S-methyltransferase subunit E